MALAIWQKYNVIYTPAVTIPCRECGGSGKKTEYYCSRCGADWESSAGGHSPGSDNSKICNNCLYTGGKTWREIRCSWCDGTGYDKYVPASYTQGTYLTAVTAEQNTYPQNGRHSDGFWYVYQGLSNRAPTISGTNSNLGIITSFLYKYSVNDTDASDRITVIERLDGIQLRSFNATRGTEYTVSLTWIEVLNGAHNLTITASDNTGTTATRTITFTKSEHELEFTLETPLTADALVTKTIMSITREIPQGALMQVFVCNNAYDAAPTWEDITSKVISEGKFFFTNTVKTAEQWGYNIKICVQRLSAAGVCHITSVGGSFE